MARDYKHAGRSGSGFSGVLGLAVGLALGLSVALAVYLHDRRPQAGEQSKPTPAQDAAPQSTEDGADRQYDFYDMLPKFEVVVPEREQASGSGGRNPIDRPGAYVLQTGSYRNFADADRARAELALQGIESKIQRVTIDSDTWHRVRIGPVEDLTELNRLRERLQGMGMEPLVIRVGG